MNLAPLRQALYNWIRTETGITVTWQEQGEPRPARPYVGLKLITGPIKSGTDDLREISPGSFEATGQRRMTLSVNVYGSDAMGIAATIQTSIEKPSVQETMGLANFALIQASQVQNLTEVLETRFETRAQLDVEIGLTDSAADPTVTYIEQVSGTGLDGEPFTVN